MPDPQSPTGLLPGQAPDWLAQILYPLEDAIDKRMRHLEKRIATLERGPPGEREGAWRCPVCHRRVAIGAACTPACSKASVEAVRDDPNPTIPPHPAGSEPRPRLALESVSEAAQGPPGLPRLQSPSNPENAEQAAAVYTVSQLLRELDTEAARCRECVTGPPHDPRPRDHRICIGTVLRLAFAMSDRAAMAGNGAAWMVWARVWCGLLLLRDLAEGAEEAQDGDARDLMRAILGIDGEDGQPDIREMAARLYG